MTPSCQHHFPRALRRRTYLALTLALTCTAVVPTAFAQHPLPETHSNYIHSLEDPKRAEWQKPEEVVAKLGLKPGEAVADLGAGSGYFTMLFAKAVGPQGTVYAVDVLPEMLEYIRQRAQNDDVKNI